MSASLPRRICGKRPPLIRTNGSWTDDYSNILGAVYRRLRDGE